ncbi:hypothetical protein WA026_023376 [Henosepilachna vigintioctopunctata]|uniref:Uncharacterized protein n=1 Tax=Henosepilachna vigintioctopunctata TaxID=420089 RepID=A0AAW1UWR9_9CUCU
MRISFVESGPEVYEYPSESSLLIDESPSPISPSASTPLTGHTVPTLSGSSLANYTPKSTEEFQPGITRSTPNIPSPNSALAKHDLPQADPPLVEEIDLPITFSSGTNSDMLF